MNQKYQHGQPDKKGQQNNQGKHTQSQGGDENKKSPAPAMKPRNAGSSGRPSSKADK